MLLIFPIAKEGVVVKNSKKITVVTVAVKPLTKKGHVTLLLFVYSSYSRLDPTESPEMETETKLNLTLLCNKNISSFRILKVSELCLSVSVSHSFLYNSIFLAFIISPNAIAME